MRGWSYAIIGEKLRIGKGTLSDWLRDVPYSPNATVRKRIKEGPAKSAMLRNQSKRASIASARSTALKTIGQLSKRDLLLLGLGLYIGEGTKSCECVQFVNADPNVICLIMRWFREVCGVPLAHFAIAVHIYPDTDEQAALQFWSNITKIPLGQFRKTQRDARLNKSHKLKNKLPHGTALITVKSCGKIELGVGLHRKIMGWIAAAQNDMRA